MVDEDGLEFQARRIEIDGAGVVVSRFVYGDGVNVPDAGTKDGVT